LTDIWKLKTVEEALAYCQERVAAYREDMSKKEKEHVASTILSFSFGDYFEEWEKEYPIVIEIETLASDLEWSNAFNIDEDWEKLKAAIEELDRQVTQNLSNKDNGIVLHE
jgi:hypothetical protein